MFLMPLAIISLRRLRVESMHIAYSGNLARLQWHENRTIIPTSMTLSNANPKLFSYGIFSLL